MVHHLIAWSLRNRYIVLLIAAGLFIAGLNAVRTNPIDAIPDLSENQVIIFTEWTGRSPQLIEDQITYPLVTNLQGMPRIKYVRGTSMFGMSFIYVVFKDNVDIYWARERVLERLSTVANTLPASVTPRLGPDGTGVGHILWYTLKAPGLDLGEQRAIQDWYVKFALQNVPGVSEIASFGGFQQEYQITLNPDKLLFYGISVQEIINAVRSNNSESGGRKFELSDIGYILKTTGYLKSLAEIENLSVKNEKGVPVLLRDIATVQKSSEPRLGIFDQDGEGERVGGIVVMRFGENANQVINQVKAKMKEVAKGLPAGVSFDIIYDRGELIKESVNSIKRTLIEEIIVVSLIVVIFLFHWQSALSIVIQIPVTIAASFLLLNAMGISSNIMSLTGIALAIGVIVDNGIIMSENAYQHLSEQYARNGGTQFRSGGNWFRNLFRRTPTPITEAERLRIIESSSKQVSRGVFFATVIIITSFLPVFLLTGQEGKLFLPLAFTKTFILIVDALLVITLAPVLLSFFMKGRFRPENTNPVNRLLERIYEPVIRFVLKWRKTTLAVNILALLISIPLLKNMGTEFMPPLDEQSILFMPVTLPDISNGEIKRILQVQDKIIKSVPEVDKVLGKAGRASTATDNAPLSMIETIIMLKPRSEWRPGVKKSDIIQELDRKLQIPGVINGWTQPIINRINMLATGIRTDVGVKIYGQDLDTIARVSEQVKQVLAGVPGITDLFAEPITGGKYLIIDPDRQALARYGLSVDDINLLTETALGGMAIGNTIEGRRRFPISLRLGEDYRNSIDRIKRLPLQSGTFGEVPLSAVADIRFEEGPPMITTENALLRGAVLFNIRDRDLGSGVEEAMQRLEKAGNLLPPGYFIEWSGQYENLIRSGETLRWILPLVLLIIFMSLYFAFKSLREAFLSLITIPFALIGGAYLVYFWGANLSVAVMVGFIALFGIAVETGIVMVIYLNDAMTQLIKLKGNSRDTISHNDLLEYVVKGASKRLRPKLMTVCVSLFGLVPVLWSAGVGTDVMKPVVLPMIGGVFTSAIHILLVTPLIFLMTKEYELRKYGKLEIHESKS